MLTRYFDNNTINLSCHIVNSIFNSTVFNFRLHTNHHLNLTFNSWNNSMANVGSSISYFWQQYIQCICMFSCIAKQEVQSQIYIWMLFLQKKLSCTNMTITEPFVRCQYHFVFHIVSEIPSTTILVLSAVNEGFVWSVRSETTAMLRNFVMLTHSLPGWHTHSLPFCKNICDSHIMSCIYSFSQFEYSINSTVKKHTTFLVHLMKLQKQYW